ncbi:sugar ABC transporter permease [Marivita lacus]|uniref:Sugar ABC transporter permease n=1 Tax=Marivita lacus TaxID=1323742 RepID=A0ABQ1LE01_9RHOB|nr:carbohydrate ABC transporter permease [Marivita lacus]GGC22353.1 sugar ABC transporter permease [Marivita lacus]
MTARRARNFAFSGIVLIAAMIWIFPLYWSLTTSLRSENRIVSNAGVLIDELNFASYIEVLSTSKLPIWYLNSVATSSITTAIVLVTGMMCAYALSQLQFPGRKALYLLVVASFMVPVPALYVAQFILMSDLGLVNTWWGIILPQLIVPVVVIVYKQFFDAIPKEMREAVLLDGGGEFTLLFKLYLPLNWGITAALAIITFISTWNNFFWPFLIVTSESMMTIPVGITQVNDAFGVAYARMMALALLAAAPVIIGYLIFQKRVTEAVMISAGVKG